MLEAAVCSALALGLAVPSGYFVARVLGSQP